MVPIRIFAPFAFGYFLSYLFRVVNAVAGPDISADIGLGTADLGFLTSVYFLAFAAVQLPLGVLLDRYAPNVVNAAFLLLAAAGAVLFAVGGGMIELTIGRALVGLGVSACLMAAFTAYATQVPLTRLPFVNGLHMAVGGLGMLAGGLPTETGLALFGWRGLFLLLAALTVAGALWLVGFGATPQPPRAGASLGRQVREVGRIMVSRRFLALAPAATLTQASGLALQSLWVGPWLRDVAGYAPSDAATVLSLFALATTAGYIASGSLASALARRGVPVDAAAAGGMALFVLAQAGIVLLPVGPAVGAWLAFALTTGSAVLAYPALTAVFPPEQSGRVNAALNFTSFVAAFLVQWGTGAAVATLSRDMSMAAAYAVPFSVLAVGQAVALAWYVLDRRVAYGRVAVAGAAGDAP